MSRESGLESASNGCLDDVMANWLWLQGIQCMTAKAEIRYRGEPIGTPVRLEGRCLKRKGRSRSWRDG